MQIQGSSVFFDSVSKSYGNVHALRNFDLRVHAGEFITILGASGSGKSTVLNALAGFSPASSGNIFINDNLITHVPPEKRNIGMVFQNYSLFPNMSVLENVYFPLHMRKVSKSKRIELANSALDIVCLSEYGDRKPKELSGGQQQRVAIARAIVFSPSLLLMDEPLGALDLKLRETLQFEIKEVQHKLGCTVIYVTHDQREALAMSDRIAVLRDGKIEQVGTPAEMYDSPSNRFVADFIGHTNLFSIVHRSDNKAFIPDLDLEFVPNKDIKSENYLISIRPERFRRVDSIRPMVVKAKLQEVIFLGDVVECSAVTTNGRVLRFKEPRMTSSTSLKRGQDIVLHLEAGDLVLVNDY